MLSKFTSKYLKTNFEILRRRCWIYSKKQLVQNNQVFFVLFLSILIFFFHHLLHLRNLSIPDTSRLQQSADLTNLSGLLYLPHPPLNYLYQIAFLHLPGPYPFYAPTIFSSIVLLFYHYKLLQQLLGQLIALASCILLCLHPIFWKLSLSLTNSLVAACFIMGAAYYALQKPSFNNRFLLATFLILSSATRVESWPFVVTISVIVFFVKQKIQLKNIAFFSITNSFIVFWIILSKSFIRQLSNFTENPSLFTDPIGDVIINLKSWIPTIQNTILINLYLFLALTILGTIALTKNLNKTSIIPIGTLFSCLLLLSLTIFGYCDSNERYLLIPLLCAQPLALSSTFLANRKIQPFIFVIIVLLFFGKAVTENPTSRAPAETTLISTRIKHESHLGNICNIFVDSSASPWSLEHLYVQLKCYWHPDTYQELSYDAPHKSKFQNISFLENIARKDLIVVKHSKPRSKLYIYFFNPKEEKIIINGQSFKYLFQTTNYSIFKKNLTSLTCQQNEII